MSSGGKSDEECVDQLDQLEVFRIMVPSGWRIQPKIIYVFILLERKCAFVLLNMLFHMNPL